MNFQQLPQNATYAWALEYHGDALPTAVGQGWTVSQNGSASTRLLAELGQDYLSTSTGLSGSDNSLSYAIGGTTGTAWAGIDFGHGAVVELRARAGSSSTTEGSASVFLGDGSHGAISLELDADSVNLEGLGGAAGQVEYSSTIHPEFSSRVWHDYRLLIEPQPAAAVPFSLSCFSMAITPTRYFLSNCRQVDPMKSASAISSERTTAFVKSTTYDSPRCRLGWPATTTTMASSTRPTTRCGATISVRTMCCRMILRLGSSTADDYDVWKSNFGMAAGERCERGNRSARTSRRDKCPFGADRASLWRTTMRSRRPAATVEERAEILAHQISVCDSRLIARVYHDYSLSCDDCSPQLRWQRLRRPVSDLIVSRQTNSNNCARLAHRHLQASGEVPTARRCTTSHTKAMPIKATGISIPTLGVIAKLKGKPGIDWGSWKLDRNRPDWQEAMVRDWAELGLNSTHLNIYPVDGKLEIDPDWAKARD